MHSIYNAQIKNMKVSGFSFVKNAIIYDYPVVEAIKSILPICDNFVVAVGKSDDETLKLIQDIDKQKISIIETEWDESLRKDGRVLAVETDKAYTNIPDDSDWAFYIQGDEVIHEKDLDKIYKAMQHYQDDEKVDGLLFNYLHFYGSYDYVGASANWYTHEVRVIKNQKAFRSHGDAKGFRKENNKKLNVIAIDASVYHYGWVKDPQAMQRKQKNFNKYWHNDAWVKENVSDKIEFDYATHVKELKPFLGEHPQVMKKRIQDKNWKFDYDISLKNKRLKDEFKRFLKKYLGIDTSSINYKIVE